MGIKWIIAGFIVFVVIVIGLAYSQQVTLPVEPEIVLLTTDEYLAGDYSESTVLVRGEVTYLGPPSVGDSSGNSLITLDNKLSFTQSWDEWLDIDVEDTITIKITNNQYVEVV